MDTRIHVNPSRRLVAAAHFLSDRGPLNWHSHGRTTTTDAMGVPFEALLPYGIMVTMFAITGTSLSAIRWINNGGKKARYSLDRWDRQSNLLPRAPFALHLYGTDQKIVMERDRRLTGFLRGQIDNPHAPAGFELSNPWKVEKRFT